MEGTPGKPHTKPTDAKPGASKSESPKPSGNHKAPIRDPNDKTREQVYLDPAYQTLEEYFQNAISR